MVKLISNAGLTTLTISLTLSDPKYETSLLCGKRPLDRYGLYTLIHEPAIKAEFMSDDEDFSFYPVRIDASTSSVGEWYTGWHPKVCHWQISSEVVLKPAIVSSNVSVREAQKWYKLTLNILRITSFVTSWSTVLGRCDIYKIRQYNIILIEKVEKGEK